MLNYKGYIGHVVYDDEAEIFHGDVINTRDVITFQGDSVSLIKKEFIRSVDDYLDFCAKSGKSPDKPFSGKFNVRLTPELHKEAVIAAKQHGDSLNAFINHAIKSAVSDPTFFSDKRSH